MAEGGGDESESGLEAVALAMTSPWTTRGDRRRQVIVVWTDQPAHPLSPEVLPPSVRERVPADFSALTDTWEDPQGPLGSSSKRLILFAPDGPGWSDISGVWENVGTTWSSHSWTSHYWTSTGWNSCYWTDSSWTGRAWSRRAWSSAGWQ